MAVVINGTTGITGNTGTLISASTVGVGGATPAASGAGITFPATQSASSNANTLDDYEEGTWTPTTSVNGFTQSISSLTGTYTKIGRVVTLFVKVTLTTVGRPSSYSVFTGAPFATIEDMPLIISSDDASMSQAYGGGYITGTSVVPTSVAGTSNLAIWLISVTYFTS